MTMRNPKVTVTMPAYNVSKFIKEAIESVLAQDYDSFELLILDDGSTDDTWEIIKRYKKDPRVRAFRNRKNAGGGAARNKTIRLARGKYISFCDADDLMLPGNLKTLSRYLDAHPGTGMVYVKTLVIDVDDKGRLLGIRVNGRDCNKGWDLIENRIFQGGAMVRKPLLIKAGLYDEMKCYAFVDCGLWLKLSEITRVKYWGREIFYIYVMVKRAKTLSAQDRRKLISYQRRKQAEAIKRRYNYNIKF
ncbi:MAG: hypothetical protein A2046_10815 [Bacteroidetes bacterium GWA2_30_7]|nr:MAG: hypothetical protein A2046_10815 [Bacteroidetes bacterium GWA2_30_7]